MAKEVVASKFLFSIENKKADASRWLKLNGITSFKFGGEDETAETNSFSKQGYKGQMVVQRGWKLEFESNYLEDITTGERDPGQAYIDQLAQELGQEAQSRLKMVAPSRKHGFYILGTPSISDMGGGVTDVMTWNFSWVIDGKIEEFTPTEADLTEFN
ncbi:phage tail tube protein [Thermoactinomyces sp. DSM 45892]|uniref:phage tail tube protein n=1 Tax=Thermoactinomyces sp. DSM 45892 TaxID=1882753 RepID=UPI000894EBE5|nr:hypothetical protein [Thermoactinomyces sp. DSM 45892]SDZ00987.1 hypothetical protein SAMN05444416_111112 [Thermoactinomyces sp. DSM 45892]